MEVSVGQPPFDAVRVRQALIYHVNSVRLIDEDCDRRSIALPRSATPFQYVRSPKTWSHG